MPQAGLDVGCLSSMLSARDPRWSGIGVSTKVCDEFDSDCCSKHDRLSKVDELPMCGKLSASK